MLAAVEEWPVEATDCGCGRATAILDGVCARRQGAWQVGTKKRLFQVEQRNGGRDPRKGNRSVQLLACDTHGVPRATIVLAKMRSFRAQATSATLCNFPAAIIRL